MEEGSAVLATLYSESGRFPKYKIRKNQLVIGRNEDACDLLIPYNNLSKQHCRILIDKGDHFIMDLDSRNKTYRKSHCLRPNTYYELTNGIQLTLADLQCQYFIGDMEDDSKNEKNVELLVQPDSAVEETPSLSKEVFPVVKAKVTPVIPSDKSDVSSVSTRSPSPQVANNVPVLPFEDPLEETKGEEEETMECSPPLLAGDCTTSPSHVELPIGLKTDPRNEDNDNEQTSAHGIQEDERLEGIGVPKSSNGSDNDATLPFDVTAEVLLLNDAETIQDSPDLAANTKTGKKVMIDPTVAYELETDEEDVQVNTKTNKTSEKGAAIEPTVGYCLEEDGEEEKRTCGDLIDPTVAYQLDEDDYNNDETMQKGDQKASIIKARAIDPTVPYIMEDEEVDGETLDETRNIDSFVPSKATLFDPDMIVDNEEKNVPIEEEEADKPEIKPKGRRLTKRGASGKKTNTTARGRGKGRLGKSSDTLLASEDLVVNEGENKKQLESGVSIKKTLKKDDEPIEGEKDPPLPTRGTSRRRGVKRQLSDDEEDNIKTAPVKRNTRRRRQLLDDEEDKNNSVSAIQVEEKDVSSNGHKGRSKRVKKEEEVKMDPEENATKPLELFNESPDIPTLTGDMPTEDNPEAVTMGEDVCQTLTVKDNENGGKGDNKVNPQGSKGRRGRKRKAPDNKKIDVQDKESDEIPIAKVNGKKQLSRKSVSKVSVTPVVADDQEQQTENNHGLTEKSKTSTGNKRVKLEISKMTKKKSLATNKEGSDEDDSLANTPVKSLAVKEGSPKVMFTGGVDENGAGTVRKLGGEMVESVFDCTHLVTDKVRRTVKFLCCLSRGCTIVNIGWLDKCRKANLFVPSEAFIVNDKANERLHKFVLKDSIAKARSTPLLKGWSVFVSENVKPCPKEMGEIIESAGGQVLEQCPVVGSDDQFVISCEEDLDTIKDSIGNGVTVCSSEVLLTGVLRQKLETDMHKLGLKKGSGRRR